MDFVLTGKADDELFSTIGERYELARQERADILENWRRNLMAYEGRRVQAIDQIFGMTPTESRGSVMLNKFQRLLRTVVAKIRAQNPKPTVIPASASDDDVSVARALEGLLQFLWRSNDMSRTEEVVAHFIVLYGTAFRRVCWNASAESTTALDTALLGLPPNTPTPKGALEITAVDPHNIFLPPSCMEIRHARWAIQAHNVHVDAIWERYNKHVEPGVKEDLPRPWLGLSTSFLTRELATVFEYWERPNKAHPKGRYGVMTANNDLLYFDNQLPLNMIPLVKSIFAPLSNRPWGKTPMFDARTAQALLNRAATKSAEVMENTAFKYIIQKGSLDVEPMPGQVGEILSINPNTQMKPDILEPSQSNNLLQNYVGNVDSMMSSIVGTEAVGEGTSPTSDASGRSVLFLAAEANTSFASAVSSIRIGLAETARMSLEFFKTYATDEILYSIVDETGMEDVRFIKPEDIKYRDVEYQVESGDAYTKQAMRDAATVALQNGAISPQTYARILELPNWQELYSDSPSQRQRAKLEYRALQEGWGPPNDPYDWENHQVHAGCHQVDMQSESFYKLDQQRQMTFYRHLLIHMAFLGQNPFPPGFVPSAQSIIPPPPPAGQPQEQPVPIDQTQGMTSPVQQEPVDTQANVGNMIPSASMEAAAMMPQANPAEEIAAIENVIAGPGIP